MVRAETFDAWDFEPPKSGGDSGGMGLDRFGRPYRFYLKKGESARITFLTGVSDKEGCERALEAHVTWNGEYKKSDRLPTMKRDPDDECKLASLKHDWLKCYYVWYFSIIEHDTEYGDVLRLLGVKKAHRAQIQNIINEYLEDGESLIGKTFKVVRGDAQTSPTIGDLWVPKGNCDPEILAKFEPVPQEKLRGNPEEIEEVYQRLQSGSADPNADDDDVPF